MIRLAVAGAAGRMGRCVLEQAYRDERFEIAAALEAAGRHPAGSAVRSGDIDVPLVDRLEGPCDVLIDFTVAAGTMAWLDACTQRDIAMVIGATGHTDEQLARIRMASRQIPILKAANFSPGLNVILNIVGRLAQGLGERYDVELVETHHRHKVDAPSGTALALLDEILAGTAPARDDDVIFGRYGHTGERPAGQIGVHSLRMGDSISQHEIHFSGPGETVTLQHTAHSRDTFAAGALRAAAWLVNKQPGSYTMRDAIG